MKRISATFSSLLILMSCSPDHRGPAASHLEAATASLTDLKPVNRPAQAEAALRAELDATISRSLEYESNRLGVPPPMDAAADDEFEVRIWVGFALTGTRCITIRHWARSDRVTLYDFKLHPSPRSPQEPMIMEPLLKELPPPRSGWAALNDFVTKKGMGVKFSLPLSEYEESYPDAPTIVIDGKSSAGYSLRFYAADGRARGSREAQKILNRINWEFGVIL